MSDKHSELGKENSTTSANSLDTEHNAQQILLSIVNSNYDLTVRPS